MHFLRKHLRRWLLSFLRRHPKLAAEALRPPGALSFASFPDRAPRNFEDLDWLLASNEANKGLMLLQFDEAAFLFRLVRSQPAAQIVEVGRFYGGTAFLFPVGGDADVRVVSVDIGPKDRYVLAVVLET